MKLEELKGLPMIKAKGVSIDFELTDENIENYRKVFDEESVVIVNADDNAYSIVGGDLCDVLYNVRDMLEDEQPEDYAITYYTLVDTKNFDGHMLSFLAVAVEAYASADERTGYDVGKSVVCLEDDICFIMENNNYDEEISQEDFDKLWNEQ